jgi:hypothetical protein
MSPRAQHRQADTLKLIALSGPFGVTWREVSSNIGAHHGSASGALSSLHRAGLVVCLAKKRDNCHVYVLPQFAGDEPIQPRTVPIADRLAQAHAEGTDQGWQEGYDAAMAASTAVAADDIRVLTAHAEGRAAGRQEEAAAVMQFVAALRDGILREKGMRVVRHDKTCWMEHPDCALKAVERSLIRNRAVAATAALAAMEESA